MASLVVRGDLMLNASPIKQSIVLRPLLYAHVQDQTDEVFPPAELLVDSFVRAVRELKEGAEPAAPGVFVINVSLGDGNRPFFGRTSAWARALDWLAHEHGILFIVSAGNASDRQHDIQMNGVASTDAFGALEGVERSKAILSGLHASVGRRRILSPAEAVNALTVGALHHDAVNEIANRGNSLDPLPGGVLPTPCSRFGPGFANAIKPDILMSGG